MAVGMGYIMMNSKFPGFIGAFFLFMDVYLKVALLCYNEVVIAGSDTSESD